MVLWAVREAVSTVTLNPDPGNLPGGAVLQQLTDGLGGWALDHGLGGPRDRRRRRGRSAPTRRTTTRPSTVGRPCSSRRSPRCSSARRRPSSTSSSTPARGCTDRARGASRCAPGRSPWSAPRATRCRARPARPARAGAGVGAVFSAGGAVGGVGRGVVDRRSGSGHVGHDVGRPRRGMVHGPRGGHGEPGGRRGRCPWRAARPSRPSTARARRCCCAPSSSTSRWRCCSPAWP